MTIGARLDHSLRETAYLWRRRWAALLLALMMCASALVLPLVVASLGFSFAPPLGRLPISPEASVFVSLTAGAQDVAALKGLLERQPSVGGVQWITRDQALAELARRSGTLARIADITPNPLPDTFVVAFRPGLGADELDAAAAEFRKLPNVDGVLVDTEWYRKLAGLGRVALRVAWMSGIVVAVLLALVIVATLRIVATADARELRLLRLLGADDRLIVRPYAWTGAIVLAVAAALAAALVTGLLTYLAPELDWLSQLLGTPTGAAALPSPYLAGLVGAAFMVGLLGGALGARLALRRINHDT